MASELNVMQFYLKRGFTNVCYTGLNWTQYTSQNQVRVCQGISRLRLYFYTQVLIQLNGDNTTLIPDTYRAEQITFINSDLAVWNR